MLKIIKYVKIGQEYLVLSEHLKQDGIYVLSLVHSTLGSKTLDIFGDIDAGYHAYDKVKKYMNTEETVFEKMAA